MIYLDTHVVAWLYGAGARSLSGPAAEAIAGSDDVRISPIVRLELQYLFEIERVTEPAPIVVDALERSLGLSVCDAPFDAVVARAEPLDWTRDPFDRIIVAHASLHEAPLVTKDASLHAEYGAAIW